MEAKLKDWTGYVEGQRMDFVCAFFGWGLRKYTNNEELT